MAGQDEDRITGGTTDPNVDKPATEAGRNPPALNRGAKAGQVAQEGQPERKQRPETGAGSPGWKDGSAEG